MYLHYFGTLLDAVKVAGSISLLWARKRIYPHVALDLSDIYRHNDYIEKANKERLSCRQTLIPCI